MHWNFTATILSIFLVFQIYQPAVAEFRPIEQVEREITRQNFTRNLQLAKANFATLIAACIPNNRCELSAKQYHYLQRVLAQEKIPEVLHNTSIALTFQGRLLFVDQDDPDTVWINIAHTSLNTATSGMYPSSVSEVAAILVGAYYLQYTNDYQQTANLIEKLLPIFRYLVKVNYLQLNQVPRAAAIGLRSAHGTSVIMRGDREELDITQSILQKIPCKRTTATATNLQLRKFHWIQQNQPPQAEMFFSWIAIASYDCVPPSAQLADQRNGTEDSQIKRYETVLEVATLFRAYRHDGESYTAVARQQEIQWSDRKLHFEPVRLQHIRLSHTFAID